MNVTSDYWDFLPEDPKSFSFIAMKIFHFRWLWCRYPLHPCSGVPIPSTRRPNLQSWTPASWKAGKAVPISRGPLKIPAEASGKVLQDPLLLFTPISPHARLPHSGDTHLVWSRTPRGRGSGVSFWNSLHSSPRALEGKTKVPACPCSLTPTKENPPTMC